MNTEIIITVEEAPEGGYLAHAVGEAVVVEADSMSDLRAQVPPRGFLSFRRRGAPKLIRLHFVRDEVIAVEREWDRSAILDDVEALRKVLKVNRRFKLAELLAKGRL